MFMTKCEYQNCDQLGTRKLGEDVKGKIRIVGLCEVHFRKIVKEEIEKGNIKAAKGSVLKDILNS